MSLTDVAGLKVGHATNREALTGCTVIVAEKGAVAGYDIRGSATGTQELSVLDPLHITPHVHAIVLSGGSAFGLETAVGVRRALAKKGVGFPTGGGVVPIVPAAILYDLGLAKLRPTLEMGEAALEAAHGGPVEQGMVGAGTGATVGKLYGLKQAMKSGVGSATVWLDGPLAGVRVSAIAAVNAFGDIRHPGTGHLIAGTRVSPSSLELADTAACLKRGVTGGFQAPQNTTLVVVATNAKLSKVGATKLAQLGQLGLARTIQPVWTMSDGDIVFALSIGDAQAPMDALGVAAAEAVSNAIIRAVESAPSVGDLPGLAK